MHKIIIIMDRKSKIKKNNEEIGAHNNDDIEN